MFPALVFRRSGAELCRANTQNVSTSLLPYGSITNLINLFDIPIYLVCNVDLFGEAFSTWFSIFFLYFVKKTSVSNQIF